MLVLVVFSAEFWHDTTFLLPPYPPDIAYIIVLIVTMPSRGRIRSFSFGPIVLMGWSIPLLINKKMNTIWCCITRPLFWLTSHFGKWNKYCLREHKPLLRDPEPYISRKMPKYSGVPMPFRIMFEQNQTRRRPYLVWK